MLYGLQRRRSESNRRMEVLQTSALPLGYGAGRTGKLFPRVALLKPQETQGSWTLAESPIWATIRAILRDRFGIPRPRNQWLSRGGLMLQGNIREARLRPEFAPLYPSLEPDVWLSATTVGQKLLLWHLATAATPQGERLMTEEHFEF